MPRVSRKPVRVRRPRLWLRKAARRAAIGIAACAVLGGLGYGGYRLWHDGIVPGALAAFTGREERAVAAGSRLGFTVQDISVTGRVETSSAAVLKALGAGRGTPIFAVDPTAARTALEALPWVRRASVERRLPDSIRIDLVERQPLALWQRDARFLVIDRDGEEIRGVPAERYPDLLVLVGDDAPAHATALIRLLSSEPGLRPSIDAAIRVGARRWNLRLVNGVEIQLPELNPTAAWSRLAALESKGKILDGSVRVVDLRLPDQTIVRVARDSAPSAPPESVRGPRLRPPRQI
jgi:cell division protein FtsQ